MQVYDDYASLAKIPRACIALGMFDGIHLAHQEIIKACVSFAKETSATSVIYTFQKHPMEVYAKKPQTILTPQTEKLRLLKNLQVDVSMIVPFSFQFSQTQPKDFINFLCQYHNITAIFCGFDYTFGINGSGRIEDLEKASEQWQYKLFVLPPFRMHDIKVSSSAIRSALVKGDYSLAMEMLGRPLRVFFANARPCQGGYIADAIPYLAQGTYDAQIETDTGRMPIKIKVCADSTLILFTAQKTGKRAPEFADLTAFEPNEILYSTSTL